MADSMSVLSESTTVRGTVRGDGDLEIRGRVEGEVDVTGELVIADGAAVRASLNAARLIVRGAVVGDLTATESIVLEATARVLGNLRAGRIAIALGAQIRGELQMELDSASIAEGARRPVAASRPIAQQQVTRPRAPLPPARSVVAHRKPPVVAAAPVAAPVVARMEETNHHAAPKKGPPPPIVPAIKKGAKALPPKRRGEGR